MKDELNGLQGLLDNYINIVKDQYDSGIRTDRQIDGDIRQLEVTCKLHGWNFEPIKEYYMQGCKNYIRDKLDD